MIAAVEWLGYRRVSRVGGREHLIAMGVEQRRHLLGSLIGVVWVWGYDRFRFVGRGFEPDDLSRPGRKGPPPVPLADADLPGEIRAGG